MKDYKSKYFGILKNIKEDYINANVFKQILQYNIYEKHPLSKCYQGSDYFGLEIEPEDYKCDFNDFFLYNNFEYCLKKEIWDDMFYLNEFHIECFHKMSDFDCNQYKIELQYLLTKEEKINYLNKLNKDFLNSINDKEYLILFLGGKKINGYKDWKHCYIAEQINDENFTYLFKFLKGERDFISKEKYNQWREFRNYKEVHNFITTTLEFSENGKVVANNNIKTEFKDIRLDIFKNEKSRELFDYIVTTSPSKKISAFFCKLYVYLQKDHIIIKDKDSKVYRNFIIEKQYLKSYVRMAKIPDILVEGETWDNHFKEFKESEKIFTQKFE